MINYPGPRWNPVLFFSGILSAVILAASWQWPPTRLFWDSVDRNAFACLNSSLSSGNGQQVFWAITNWRPFDLVGGLAILLVAVFWAKRDNELEFFSYKALELLIFAMFLIVFNVTVQMLFEVIDYSRPSPTKVFENAVRLTDQVPWINTKDSSSDSFPGDHAYILLSMATFFFFRSGLRTGILSTVLFVPFIIPRLVSGAHWITDVLIGSVAMTLFVISLWFSTPLGISLPEKAHKKFYPVLQRFVKRFRKKT